jgi:hypothetical protein
MLCLDQAFRHFRRNHNRAVTSISCLWFLVRSCMTRTLPISFIHTFAGHNSLSAFTAIVKDWVTMFLGVLVLHEPSPLGGAARWRFRTGPIIDRPKTGCLLRPLKHVLVIDLNKSGFEVMDQLPPTPPDTHLSKLKNSFSPSDESSPMSYLLTFEWAFRLGLQWGLIK